MNQKLINFFNEYAKDDFTDQMALLKATAEENFFSRLTNYRPLKNNDNTKHKTVVLGGYNKILNLVSKEVK